MARLAHTSESMADALRTQLRLLQSAVASFDQGDTEQCLNIATRLRVLLHDHEQPGKAPTSTSVLQLVGFKDKIRFVDTARIGENPVLGHPSISIEFMHDDGTTSMKSLHPDGLAAIRETQTGAHYVAPLGYAFRQRYKLRFKTWWTHPIMDFTQGEKYSRFMLVRAMANAAGGAHLDPRGLDEGYAAFLRDGIDHWLSKQPFDPQQIDAEGFSKAQGDPIAASMRQIAYEFLLSVDECSELQAWLIDPRQPDVEQ